MTTRSNLTPENITPCIIRFQNKDYQLSAEQLRKQIGKKIVADDNWYPATLKFVSFKGSKLQLVNSCNKLSYKLFLQILEGRLQATCSCGNGSAVICNHVYGALRTIIWELGERYFEKLQPDGAIPLAFAHKNYFDKKECKAGLDVSVRPELGSVFKLDQRLASVDLSLMLILPVSVSAPFISLSPKTYKDALDEAIGYLLIIPFRNRFLPFVVPCAGKLIKSKTGIKTFYNFLSGAKKQYNHLLADGQKELNTACFELWKLTEKLSGYLLEDHEVKKITDNRLLVFDAWHKIIALLKQQSFVYSYFLYRTEELKKDRPAKGRTRQIQIASETPELRFVLTDCGAFYQLAMDVLVKGEPLTDYEADTTFFVSQGLTIYLLSSLRDAAIAQWMEHSGGILTVFKEHFSQFVQDILNPIRQCYAVKMVNRHSK
ncbi:MAG: hypothetical protein IM598_15825 [Chitinophagaceae bacterium]|nr:hypothetical protein [Chitinophagaceae bacterium]MCA6459763.1 hypothetical protein [Chitinophagaceae bacterium]MCA6466296.1 hypothetical protein [Chitinophagaceae bacterium]